MSQQRSENSSTAAVSRHHTLSLELFDAYTAGEPWAVEYPDTLQVVVRICIDGQDLNDMFIAVEDSEKPDDMDSKNSYGHLSPWGLNNMLSKRSNPADYVGFNCCAVCGDDGCWGVYSTAAVSGTEVRWYDFCHWHRSYQYGFSFVFERRQYEMQRALLRLMMRVQEATLSGGDDSSTEWYEDDDEDDDDTVSEGRYSTHEDDDTVSEGRYSTLSLELFDAWTAGEEWAVAQGERRLQPVVRIRIDGQDINDRLIAVESARSGHRQDQPPYGHLNPGALYHSLTHTDEHDDRYVCCCAERGIPDDRGVRMAVTVSDTEVIWHGFARGQGTYEHGLRFVFERRQYDRQLSLLRAMMEAAEEPYDVYAHGADTEDMPAGS